MLEQSFTFWSTRIQFTFRLVAISKHNGKKQWIKLNIKLGGLKSIFKRVNTKLIWLKTQLKKLVNGRAGTKINRTGNKPGELENQHWLLSELKITPTGCRANLEVRNFGRDHQTEVFYVTEALELHWPNKRYIVPAKCIGQAVI